MTETLRELLQLQQVCLAPGQLLSSCSADQHSAALSKSIDSKTKSAEMVWNLITCNFLVVLFPVQDETRLSPKSQKNSCETFRVCSVIHLLELPKWLEFLKWPSPSQTIQLIVSSQLMRHEKAEGVQVNLI